MAFDAEGEKLADDSLIDPEVGSVAAKEQRRGDKRGKMGAEVHEGRP